MFPPHAPRPGLRALLVAVLALFSLSAAAFGQGTLSVGNLVFEDVNGNGRYDDGTDEGVDGVVVQLFASTADPFVDPPVDQTVTTAGGLYYFQALNAGEYKVFIPPAEFQAAEPLAGMMNIPGLADSDTDDDVGEDGLEDTDPGQYGILSRTFTLAAGTGPLNGGFETGAGATLDDAGDGDADGDLTIDLGFYRPLSLGNLVFADMNLNGQADLGEGIPGVVVQLFDSADDPATDPSLADVTTDVDGHFLFSGLQAGSYKLYIPPSEFGTTGALQGVVSVADTVPLGPDDDAGEDGIDAMDPAEEGVVTAAVLLAPGQAPTFAGGETGLGSAADDASDADGDLTVDFGFLFEPDKAGVGNLVFVDSNDNGTADEGEGVDGVVVRLYAAGTDPEADMAVDVRITSRGGFYLFGNVDPGDYYLYIPPGEFDFGRPLFAGLPLRDSAVEGDDDAAQEGGSAGLPQVKGVYTPVFSLATGMSIPDESGLGSTNDDFRDNDVDLTHDLGFEILSDEPLGVGNLVFVDMNHSGEFDDGEGTGGVTVRLYRENDDPELAQPVAETVTDVNGLYSFGGLPPGGYYLHVPASDFENGGALNGLYSMPGTGGDDHTDDNLDENGVDEVSPAVNGVSSGVFTLSDDNEPTDEGDETGFAFEDDNADDDNTDLTIDLGFEEACPVITISPAGQALPAGMATVPYSRTQSAIGGVEPYTWSSIGVLPDGLTVNAATGALAGIPEVTGDFTFDVRATDANGCFATISRTITITPAPPPLGVGNMIAVDANYDGVIQPGEGVDEVTVELYQEGLEPGEDTPQAITETAGGGRYAFSNLLPGSYFIHIPAAEFESGGQLFEKASLTGAGEDAGVDDNLPGGDDGLDAANPVLTGISSVTFALAPGEEPVDAPGGTETGVDAAADNAGVDADFDATIDLVFVASPQVSVGIGNLVFDDTANRNGRYDADEGVDGVTVQLFADGADAATDDPVAARVTVDGGRYYFPGLPPGAYFVHIPASQFAPTAPLDGMVSVNGHSGDDGEDDDEAGENGIDQMTPASTGISTAVITLTLGGEPTGADTETGFASTDDDVADSNTDLTVDLGFAQSCPSITITPPELAAATLDQAYSVELGVSGGTGPYVWALSSGTLPDGLTFNTTTHTLEGTPVEEGTFNVAIRATDATGCQSVINYAVNVLAEPELMGVGNIVFLDSNGSGQFDPGEDGVPNVLVQLFAATADIEQDPPLASTTTDAFGLYGFTGLPVGNYFVRIPGTQFGSGMPLEGLVSMAGNGGDDGTDDDVDENGIDSATPATTGINSVVFHLSPDIEPTDNDTETGRNAADDNADDGRFDATIDLGFVAPASAVLAVGNAVFSDADRNGVYDFNEGRAGVTVNLFQEGADAQGGTPAATQVTSTGGHFLFTGLLPGRYFLHVPAGMFAGGQPLAGQFSVPGAGADDGVDDESDENGLDAPSPAATGVSSIVFTLGVGQEPADVDGEVGFVSNEDDASETDVNLTMDLGFAFPNLEIAPASLPDGEVGQEYAQEFSTEDGTAPHTFTLGAGYLPAGLLLNTDGTLAGTPEEAGEFPFTVVVTDANGGQDEKDYTLTIEPAQVMTLGNLVFLDTNANGTAENSEGVDGVTVELYGGTDTPELDAPRATQITAGGGRYLFTGLEPGSYLLHIPPAMFAADSPLYHTSSMGGVGTGDDDSDEDGQDAVDPELTGVSTAAFTLTPGMAPTDATFESGLDADSDNALDANGDLTRDFGFVDTTPLPATFSDWIAVHSLGGDDAPAGNPDGDLDNNLMEYALLGDPESGVKNEDDDLFHLEQNAGGGYDLWFHRRRGGAADLLFELQLVTELGEASTDWDPVSLTPVIIINNDGTETVRFNDIQNDPALGGATSGFARLRVVLDANRDTIPEAEAVSQAFGWGRRELQPRNQTYAIPLMTLEVISGQVDGVAGNEVDLSTAAGVRNIANQFGAGSEYFLEVVDGDQQGQRWEIDEATSTGTTVMLLPAHPRSTRATVPADLAGDSVAVRPHWRAMDLFPVADFNATNNPGTADQLLFFDQATGSYTTFWLYLNGGTRIWVRLGDATLADSGGRVVGPCEGLFTKPRGGAVDATVKGLVRTWPMACPLLAGTNFIGNPWPVDQSPGDRGMTTGNGFTGAANFASADRIYRWDGDTTSTSAYTNYFLLLSPPTYNQWTRNLDGTLEDQTATPLFQVTSANFIISVNGNPNWMLTPPYTP